MRVAHGRAVEPYGAVADLDPITGDTDHPLDKVGPAIVGRDKYHDVATVDLPEVTQVLAQRKPGNSQAQDRVLVSLGRIRSC